MVVLESLRNAIMERRQPMMDQFSQKGWRKLLTNPILTNLEQTKLRISRYQIFSHDQELTFIHWIIEEGFVGMNTLTVFPRALHDLHATNSSLVHPFTKITLPNSLFKYWPMACLSIARISSVPRFLTFIWLYYVTILVRKRALFSFPVAMVMIGQLCSEVTFSICNQHRNKILIRW